MTRLPLRGIGPIYLIHQSDCSIAVYPIALNRQYLVGLQWIVDLAVNVEAELAKEVSQEADSDGPVSLILMEGKDPVTDLRAMGHLGLSSVHYFSCTYPKWARSVITRANHPKHWYPFAITLIQITSFLYSRLQDGTLNATLMSLIEANDSDDADEDFKQPVQCVAFFDTCCYMADLFDRNWTFGKHTNVMEHPRVMRETEEAILSTVRGEKIMARFLPVRQFTRGLE
ncbi:hypothetical protein SARC_01169 [Sphaeroforma arctica JP610]|uniref:ELMO domain-containing protein n=1 Tax=Sphaeroforma arctica JP610 TaxID=667725 RepID=A0A0L0GEM9_9EUKA|nr:hypothetical protein SARC_01169 [Sphaeroforma arctica JP610]KNC86703.1 hypothetical protein SARC_01169 [Sphaeroforma arctica JP610]|eukprot:XP_014160605.1 hypothetical protein SARC_01169 [Sphaeroforma arctica JP610]